MVLGIDKEIGTRKTATSLRPILLFDYGLGADTEIPAVGSPAKQRTELETNYQKWGETGRPKAEETLGTAGGRASLAVLVSTTGKSAT